MARFKIKVNRKGKVTIKRKAPFRKKRYIKKKPKYPTAISPIFRTSLNYADTYYRSYDSVTTTSINSYRLNDLYDPDYTNVGHQAKYRDQLYQWYQVARVIGYSIQVRVFSDSSLPMSVCFGPGAKYTVDNHLSFMEDRRTQKKMVSLGNPVIFKYKNYTDKHLGNKKGTWNTDDTFRQVPTGVLGDGASCWFHIHCYRMNPGEIVSNRLYFQYFIKQYTQFQQPVHDIGQS